MSINLKREHFIEPYSYIISMEDGLCKAKNTRTLAIDFKDKKASKVIQGAMAVPGKIYIKYGKP